MNKVLSGVQECIHYEFSRVKLLITALTHSSYANEQTEPIEDNERLEFLGDAVLELCISGEAFSRYQDAPEGQLTRIRSMLVKEKSLAMVARRLGLDKFLLLGKGEESQGGRDRDSLLSDALEALIGAVYLDGGFDSARKMILDLFESHWPESADVKSFKDYKSKLQEVLQKRFGERPVYSLTGTSGPDHEKDFHVEINLPSGEIFNSTGSSMKKAEQIGARKALEYLQEEFDSP